MLGFETTESLDTNVILRVVLHDVEDHFEKADKLLKREGVKYKVFPTAITECVYVLTKTMKYSREQTVGWLSDFLNMPNIIYDKEMCDEAFSMFLKYKSLSFEDCCLSLLAARRQVEPLWTFDQALAKKSPTAKLVV